VLVVVCHVGEDACTLARVVAGPEGYVIELAHETVGVRPDVGRKHKMWRSGPGARYPLSIEDSLIASCQHGDYGIYPDHLRRIIKDGQRRVAFRPLA